VVFCVATPCGVVGGYQCFGETYWLIFSVEGPEDGGRVICQVVCTHPPDYTVSWRSGELNKTIDWYLELMNIGSSEVTQSFQH
jgi:hypothetical protein